MIAPHDGDDSPTASAPVFPATSSLLAPDALLAEIAQAYDIGTLLDCALVRSYVNDVYLLTTTTERYIVKVYRAHWRSFAEIA